MLRGCCGNARAAQKTKRRGEFLRFCKDSHVGKCQGRRAQDSHASRVLCSESRFRTYGSHCETVSVNLSNQTTRYRVSLKICPSCPAPDHVPHYNVTFLINDLP
jgi:hypothetical protein